MRLCSDLGLGLGLGLVDVTKIEMLITILIHLLRPMNITTSITIIIWGLGKRRRATRRHIRFVCRTRFLARAVRVLMLVLVPPSALASTLP